MIDLIRQIKYNWHHCLMGQQVASRPTLLANPQMFFLEGFIPSIGLLMLIVAYFIVLSTYQAY